MLGYNTFRIKLQALTVSGTLSAMAGAAYALMFAYIGSSFATIQYSIDPLLYSLLGGAGTVAGRSGKGVRAHPLGTCTPANCGHIGPRTGIFVFAVVQNAQESGNSTRGKGPGCRASRREVGTSGRQQSDLELRHHCVACQAGGIG